MVYNEIKHIIKQFEYQGKYVSADELTSGNINSTYLLKYEQENGKNNYYILQKINTVAFKNPHELMNNIQLVTHHISEAMARDKVDSTRRTLEFINSSQGDYIYHDDNDRYWRSYAFIDNARAYDAIEEPWHFYEAGRGFGEFQKYLVDFPAEKLTDTIPDFHNTTKRFYDFVAAVAEDKAGHVSSLEKEIDFFFDRRKMMNKIIELMNSGTLPVRVTHNDTKLNNVLMDISTGKALCVIDLDTVMPGSILYDYGDAIRYGACTAAEDEEDISKIGVDMNLFRLFTDGFVSEIAHNITDDEIKNLPLGILVITCELAMRFLTDYINGDVYFKVKYPEHNLVRARAQMRLLEVFEAKYDEMQAYIYDLLKEKYSD